ncbi:helix-turn-helix domain-containing protein [Microbacterium sp. NPDC058345]|uniref:helix-turn-helix domain-containing protein n=1 Tax=Microbacterium sp. NPDC058345 TaxID=3346455 RepID=UPI00365210BF
MTSELAAVLRALGDGADVDPERMRAALPHDTAAADALVELAHRTAALRTRSAELRVMMSSTRELLAEPDAALMLQRIVDRAHELIAGDVAYLSVYDPEQDQLHVRAASGTISSRFLGMVVPAGVGLASRAVRTRHPQWVQDYAALTSVPHDPIIDAILREEQLRAMLGAPLVVKGEVLGVLFTASREARVYRPEEISLLSAFAGHAALVLHVARLLAAATAATTEAAIRQQQAEWAAGLHAELTRLAVIGHDADAIVGALSDALGRRVTFADGQSGRDALGSAIQDAGESGRAVVLDEGPIELVAPVIDATETPGALIVERADTPLTPVERRTVERSALTAALVLLRRDALADAEERVRGELATELLSGTARREPALMRAAARGYPVAETWTAAAVRCPPESRPRLLSRFRRRADWLVTADGDGIAVLAPGRPERAAGAVREAAGQERLLLVIASGGDLGDAADALRGAWPAARLAHGLGITEGVMDAAVLAPYALLFDGDGTRLAQFVDRMLHPVVRWDAAKGTTLFATLVALFDAQWSLASAARVLHVHVNTLKQRVGRLRELLGTALDPGEARFRLEMAVRVERARRELDQT